jgi:three-Cys-motif partner protein
MTKTREKYEWLIGSTPPPIDAHSLVKHQIVRDYLSRYIQILMGNVRVERLALSIVDGFAGGGEYSDPAAGGFRDGSPLIAIDTVDKERARLNVDRFKPRHVDAKYYFVEKSKSSVAYLNALLGQRIGADRLASEVSVRQGLFQKHFDGICAEIKARKMGERALFLLDQFAYDQVPGPLLGRIFKEITGAEVILTFNVDSLTSFLSNNDKSHTLMRRMGMESYVDWQAVDALKSAPAEKWRSMIQRNLAHGLVQASGAKHYTIFYITPLGKSPWTYWLVHLSNSYRARDVMMDLHWQQANHFSNFLEPDIFTLGYRTGSDSKATHQAAMELGEEHRFDAIADERCRNGLERKLVPLLYDRDEPVAFGDFLSSIGSSTPATAEMIRRALSPAIQAGELAAYSADGARREKGSTVKATDMVGPSRQRMLFLPGGP